MKNRKHRTTNITLKDGPVAHVAVIEEIDAVHLEPGHYMLFIVSNETADKYTLFFDPAITATDLVIKETRLAPLAPVLTTTAVQNVVLESGEVGTIRVQVQPKKHWSGGTGTPPLLAFTTYKYTLHLTNNSSPLTLQKDIDPDFDMAPPN